MKKYDLLVAGGGTSHYLFKEGDYYKIPYRCLLPKEYDNLLVAGRCISVTHEAQASIRIIPICTCLGQARVRQRLWHIIRAKPPIPSM